MFLSSLLAAPSSDLERLLENRAVTEATIRDFLVFTAEKIGT